jgi:soluble lytic murein transglycosylase
VYKSGSGAMLWECCGVIPDWMFVEPHRIRWALQLLRCYLRWFAQTALPQRGERMRVLESNEGFVKRMGLGLKSFGVAVLVGAVAAVGAQTTHRKTTATVHAKSAATTSAARSSAKKKSTAHLKTSAKGKGHSAAAKAAAAKAAAKANDKNALASSRRSAAEAAHETAQSLKLQAAFTASSQLRPMAQQLLVDRTAAAYNGVLAYAGSHPGEASAAAYLAVGHAYALDHRYPEAETTFREAGQRGEALADYADYLGAQAAISGGRASDALPLLDHFAERHPGSLFVPTAPVLLSNAYLALGDASSAVRVLAPYADTTEGSHVDFRLALAKAYQASGDPQQAAALYRGIYLGDPLSTDADVAKKQLVVLNVPLTPGERKQHADLLFNAKHYEQAEEEYRAMQKDAAGLSQADKDALDIYAAVCDLRLKKLTRTDVNRLPVTSDDSAALKMYLQSEYARSEGDSGEHDRLVQQMVAQYPHSRWLEEALYSGGNMYLIKHDQQHALAEYVQLVTLFPHSIYAPSAHWHAAWLSYRLRQMPEAARLMDEQIVNYNAGIEIPGALYWRGRLYEDGEHNLPQAMNYYKALQTSYINSYYAILARVRMQVLGAQPAVEAAPALASVRPLNDPHLTDALPENDPHLIKARLLANAALNEYIRPEIQLSDTSASWGALAEAEIYESFGEDSRALQAMKRSGLPFFSLPVAEVPNIYWQLVFPRPYWAQIQADSVAVGVDPFLTASLIRQESEFNPSVVSHANAWGLMQLLPSTGKMWAKKHGEKHFNTNELLNPTENLELGTSDLKATIDRFGGTVEYALAAYNAGDSPVRSWISSNDYKDVPEWVESIPYTETREYVQAILRNRELYRAVYAGR